MAEALRSIAGLPPLHDLLPSASSLQWRRARTAFERAALDHGCRLRLRSPAMLWQLLHGSGLPRGATWEGLLRDLTVAALAHRAQTQAPRLVCRIATWNCRWLPALTTSSGRSKAGQVQRAVRAGTMVLLQETHLDDAAMALWAAGLHGCRVIHSSAQVSPCGRWIGGVAICFPDAWQLLAHTELVPGYALEGLFAEPTTGGTVRARSVYLPPQSREDTWRAYEACGPAGPADCLAVGGDLNVPLELPRNAREASLAQAISATLDHHALMDLNGSAPTHRAARSEAAIDVFCVPGEAACTWRLTRQWKPTLSDHAWLEAVRLMGSATRGHGCTAAAMASLPEAAMRDLRLRFHTLGVMYQVPPTPIDRPTQPPGRPPRLDELVEDDAPDGDHGESAPGGGDAEDEPDLPSSPSLWPREAA